MSEALPIVHSTWDSALRCLLKYSAVHCHRSDVSCHYRLTGVSASSCVVMRAMLVLAAGCRVHYYHSDVLVEVWMRGDHDDCCRATRSLVTWTFVAMEGHFDCKLIAEWVSNCEVVICPSRVICRMYKVSLRRDLGVNQFLNCFKNLIKTIFFKKIQNFQKSFKI